MSPAFALFAAAGLAVAVVVIVWVVGRARRNERDEPLPWNRTGEEERGPWGSDQ